MNFIGAKNEVSEIFLKELKAHRKKHKDKKHIVPFPKGQLDCIISDVKERRNIDEGIIDRRILRGNVGAFTPSGPPLPLA